MDDATEFLQAVLKAGPRLVPDLEREARLAGLLGPAQPISQCKPIRTAREKLGIVPQKLGMDGGWVWAPPKMPSEAEDALTKDRAPSGSRGHLRGPEPSTAAPSSDAWPDMPDFLRRQELGAH